MPPPFLPTSMAGMAKWSQDFHVTRMQPQHASQHGALGGRFQSVGMQDEIYVAWFAVDNGEPLKVINRKRTAASFVI